MWKVGVILAVLAVLIILPIAGYNPLSKITLPEIPLNNGGEGSSVPTTNGGGGAGAPAGSVNNNIQRPTVPVDYGKTGIFFPLFGLPGSMWDDMLQYRLAHPSLPWIAVVNPLNGPGDGNNYVYETYINKMQTANIQVVGYVSTFWGAVPPEKVKSDIDKWKDYYHVDGIFIDEMSNKAGDVKYYKDVTAYAKSIGIKLVIGNTGTDATPEYVGAVDNIVISEGYGAPTLSRLGGWHVNYDKKNFSYIAYSQSTVDRQYVATSSSFASYIYITDNHYPNPYDEIPSHFDELLALLDPGVKSDMHNVVAKGVDLAGKPVNGTLEISLDGNKVASGKGWVTFLGTEGKTYQVTAQNNRDYVFAHWEDGSKDRTRSVSLDSSTIATAYYTTREEAAKPGVTINAMTDKGSELSMWTVVESDGKTVASGFTPLRFSGSPGQQYTATVGGYQYFTFDKWMDGRDSNSYKFTYSGDGFLTAYYKDDSPDKAADTLTVNTYDKNGTIITMYTTVKDGDKTVGEGYTPLTVPVESGKSYTVGVADWQNEVFDHWDNGSRNRFIDATIAKPHENLTAYYTTK